MPFNPDRINIHELTVEMNIGKRTTGTAFLAMLWL